MILLKLFYALTSYLHNNFKTYILLNNEIISKCLYTINLYFVFCIYILFSFTHYTHYNNDMNEKMFQT